MTAASQIDGASNGETMRWRLANTSDVRDYRRSLGDAATGPGAPGGSSEDSSIVVAPSLVMKTVVAGVTVSVLAHVAIRLIEGWFGWERRR